MIKNKWFSSHQSNKDVSQIDERYLRSEDSKDRRKTYG